MTPRLAPFRAEHLMNLVDRDQHPAVTWDYAVELERGGPAYTGLVHEKVIACAGVRVMWPGVGGAWVAVGEDATPYTLWLTKIVKRVLADIIRTQKLHRVEAQVLADNERNLRWMKALGFQREGGVARAYTSDQRDMVRFELVL